MRITFIDLPQICSFLSNFIQQKIVTNMNERTSATWWIRQRRFAPVCSRRAFVSNREIYSSQQSTRLFHLLDYVVQTLIQFGINDEIFVISWMCLYNEQKSKTRNVYDLLKIVTFRQSWFSFTFLVWTTYYN